MKQEKFELEVLERLNSKRLLNSLVFVGGTMLRLCYGLDRYSVDLDFWVIKDIDFRILYRRIKSCLAEHYRITESANKFHTILFELKSPEFTRSLKLEIRKEPKKVKTETAIAYSNNANTQVLLKTVALPDMMKAKVMAFLDRKEIRDVYDIEFLFKRGIDPGANKEELARLLRGIENLTKNDYSVKLGSLLEPSQRRYYRESNFKILKMHLNEKLSLS